MVDVIYAGTINWLSLWRWSQIMTHSQLTDVDAI